MQQRSLLTTWLLLAATLSVDIVMVSQLMGEPNLNSGYWVATAHALLISQMSVICIWSALCPTPSLWSRMVPYLAAVVAAVVAGLFLPLYEYTSIRYAFANFLGYFGLHAVALLAALWLVQRTPYWRKRSTAPRVWQFSILHILVVMTITAVLLALLRNNVFLAAGSRDNMIAAFCTVLLAFACVLLWSLSWHWFFRFASTVVLALIAGAVTVVLFTTQTSGRNFTMLNVLIGYYVIQAVILSLWLGIAPILPPRTEAMDLSIEDLRSAT